MKRLSLPAKIGILALLLVAGFFGWRKWHPSLSEEPDSLFGEAFRSYAKGNHPTDAAMEANFNANAADFDKLIRMAKADAKVIRITDTYTWLEDNPDWPRPQSEWGITPQRWDDYKRLFKKLGVAEGLDQADDGKGSIRLVASTKGLRSGGSDKGFAYCEKELTPAVGSLDHVANAQSNEPVFKKLKEHWYLYYMEYE